MKRKYCKNRKGKRALFKRRSRMPAQGERKVIIQPDFTPMMPEIFHWPLLMKAIGRGADK